MCMGIHYPEPRNNIAPRRELLGFSLTSDGLGMDRFNVFITSEILHIECQDFRYGMQVHNGHKTGIVRILSRNPVCRDQPLPLVE